MSFEVRKAKRQRRPLKISLEGLSGSGKTFSALRLAFAMRRAGIGRRIVVADSENESASLYDGVRIDGETWEYDVCPIPADRQNPAGYAEVYEYLVGQGFDVVIVDSMSHAWHGAQEIVDRHAASNKGDKFGGWAKVTPAQRHMLTTLTDTRAHLIATMRVKSEYERTVDERTGRDKIKKVGMKTDQREGAEYEFDAVVRLEAGHEAHVEKVRGCMAMDGKSATAPGPDFWKPLFDWWLSAEPVVQRHETLADGLRKAGTLDALAAAWKAANAAKDRLSPVQLGDLTRLKDERKAALTPAPAPPPAADPAPLPAGVVDEADAGLGLEERDALICDYEAACERVGAAPMAFFSEHSRQVGAFGGRLPDYRTLSDESLTHLLGLARQREQLAGAK